MIDKQIIEILTDELRARICPLEAIKALRSIENGNNPNQLNSMFFPIHRPEVLRSLIEFNYSELLLTLLAGIEIHEKARDNFASEMDLKFVELVDETLKKQRQKITAMHFQRGVLIEAPDFLLDISLPAISQIHSELELTANHFHDFLAAVDGNKDALFLNSKGASRASNAIMCWISRKMGIPTNYGINCRNPTGVM